MPLKKMNYMFKVLKREHSEAELQRPGNVHKNEGKIKTFWDSEFSTSCKILNA